jgi:plasmanylethanolamine desaturase
MSAAPSPGYSPRQRRLEACAIVTFVLLAGWMLWQLCMAAGIYILALAILAVPCGWLLADLLTGLVHLAFDSLGSVRTPIIGPAFIRPFREHHTDPLEITRHDFVETNGASCLACLPILAGALLMQPETLPWIFIHLVLWVTVLGALATNQFHKWAHMDPALTPAAVRWGQRHGLILSREQHQLHHSPPFDSNYCISSGWFNRPLDALLRTWR